MIPYTIDWAIGLTVAGTATALFNHRAIAEWIHNEYHHRKGAFLVWRVLRAEARAQHGRRSTK